MSWLRSAVNKAVEVGGKNNITRAVKNYADSVVQHAGQAVAGGAKIIQDRMGVRNYKSFKQTVRRLEEVAVYCRGVERTQLLRRWLVALKEIERASGSSLDDKSLEHQLASEDSNLSSQRASMVFYFDSDVGGEPLNFRDVFLCSQALEGITLSMILDPPNEEELALLLEIFGLCLSGGKEVHNAILSSIQDLANAISDYHDEVLVKRDELLQFARSAITGLKLSADITRIDVQAVTLRQKVDGLQELREPTKEDQKKESEQAISATIEALRESLVEIRLCSKLEALLIKKKSVSIGDSPEAHIQKVDKLKVLAESLSNSSLKAEKRISDHRHQKEEALNFRLSKAKEVTETEKELSAEIAGLEKQRDKLEVELEKVSASLKAATSRLKKTREERDQFDEASDQLVVHLKSKEDDLSRSIASSKVEANVVRTWINFLEDTWLLQSSYSDQMEKQTNEELEKYGKFNLKLINNHLLACKAGLTPDIYRIRSIVENLKKLSERSEILPSTDDGVLTEPNPKKYLEEEYLKVETKIVATFSVIDNAKNLFNEGKGNTFRGNYSEIDKLFDEMERVRVEFESIERPILDIETPPERDVSLADDKLQKTSSQKLDIENQSERAVTSVDEKSQRNTSHIPKNAEVTKSDSITSQKTAINVKEQHLDPEAELAMLESEFGKVSGEYTSEEIGGWEFDELEQELRSGNPSGQK